MAIVAREQARVEIEAEQAGEAAEFLVQNPWPMRALQKRRHALQSLVVKLQIESGILVGQISHGRIVISGEGVGCVRFSGQVVNEKKGDFLARKPNAPYNLWLASAV